MMVTYVVKQVSMGLLSAGSAAGLFPVKCASHSWGITENPG
jgi:hypothetical protein